MDKNCEDIHTCSFCEKTSNEVDLLIAGPDDKVLICSGCVRICEAVLADYDRSDIYLSRIPGTREEQKEKLRPITRMPKKWLVYDVNPYAATPYVTACDSSGEKRKIFLSQSSLPIG